ncbi:hypothetical protein F4808DRAFT_421174 [Astrocystis sublimbata]|nr:hypothetical protein F4808DRAFT_421174 [Astrocystis sublimbata]
MFTDVPPMTMTSGSEETTPPTTSDEPTETPSETPEPTTSDEPSETPSETPEPTTSESEPSETPVPTEEPTSSEPPSTTSEAPKPTATWFLTAYDVDCDDLENNSGQSSYYSLEGYSAQSPDEPCSNLKSGLPKNSATGDSCSWFTDGGNTGPNDCSEGTFNKPKSFRIRSGFCTIYEETECGGSMNGVSSQSYTGCVNVDDAFVGFDWNSMRCFAFEE